MLRVFLQSLTPSPATKSHRHLRPLWMPFEAVPRFRRKLGLTVNGFVQWFGASRSSNALQPAASERFFNQFQQVGSDSSFLFFARSVADADEESCKEQCDSEHRTAGIGGQHAGTCR